LNRFAVSFCWGSCGAFIATLISYYLDNSRPLLISGVLSCHQNIHYDIITNSQLEKQFNETCETALVFTTHRYIFKSTENLTIVGIDYDLDDVQTISTMFVNKKLARNWTIDEYNTMAGSSWPPYHPNNVKDNEFVRKELINIYTAGIIERKQLVDISKFDHLLTFKNIMNLDNSNSLNDNIAKIVNRPRLDILDSFISEYQEKNYKQYIR